LRSRRAAAAVRHNRRITIADATMSSAPAPHPTNDLERLFHEHQGRLMQKWAHYFGVYDEHVSRFRGTDVTIVEFGVNHGGSLQLWRKYFGPKARIYGVDINPHCKSLEEDGVEIFIGDQADRSFLRSIAQRVPRIDILIDDGGHTMAQQIATFEELFPCVAERGVYLCEDTHTSYWRKYGGGLRRRGSFIEYSKRWIDALNAWHSEDTGRFAPDDFTRTVRSVSYYDSMVVVHKAPMHKSEVLAVGSPAVADWVPPPSALKATRRRLKQALKGLVGKG
jgi:23S rRNA U2552 (ribose-2'-O)-methylase RlmE/FtsJ